MLWHKYKVKRKWWVARIIWNKKQKFCIDQLTKLLSPINLQIMVGSKTTWAGGKKRFIEYFGMRKIVV